jgi:dedicator of cytokinesis protein 3
VRMYALSVSLAFQEIHSETTLSSARMSTDTLTYGPAATPTMSSFPEITMPKGSSLGTSDISALSGTGQHDIPSIAKVTKFYHVFVDVRAFVASLCSPGETAELFFSLYNKAESHFITEEFCAVLNHNGVLARNPSAKIRSLFVDLVESDAQDPIFLVCRIVRNGSLKLGSTFSTGVPDGSPLERRASQASFRDTHVNSPPPSHIMNGAGRMVQVNDSPYNFRRPFGCAVLELTQLSSLVAERVTMSATKEFTMPIWVPSDEAAFAMVHNDIIANNTKELIKSPR